MRGTRFGNRSCRHLRCSEGNLCFDGVAFAALVESGWAPASWCRSRCRASNMLGAAAAAPAPYRRCERMAVGVGRGWTADTATRRRPVCGAPQSPAAVEIGPYHASRRWCAVVSVVFSFLSVCSTQTNAESATFACPSIGSCRRRRVKPAYPPSPPPCLHASTDVAFTAPKNRKCAAAAAQYDPNGA